MSNFSSVLKNLRIAENLTQDDLAKSLKISRSTIGMYENGSREPNHEMLEAIADFFNVDIDYLLGRTNKTTFIPETHTDGNWYTLIDDDYKKIFSKNLKYYMELNGKTQIDIINDLGINKSAISTWYNGTRLPRMDKVNMLANYFHISRSDLIEERKPTDEKRPDYSSTSTPEEFATIIKPYRKLDGAGQDAVKHTLDRETARLEAITQLREQLIKESARPSIVRDPNAEYLVPNAAHERNGKYTEEDRLDDETLLD